MDARPQTLYMNGLLCTYMNNMDLPFYRFIRVVQSPSALTTLGPPVRLALMTACLEVVHALTGLVRTSVGPTVIQTLMRLFILVGVCEGLGHPDISASPVLPMMCGIWAVSEVMRYAYYFLLPTQPAKSMGGSGLVTVRAALQWARYSLFYILYPLGAGSEAYLLYLSLPSIAYEYGLAGTIPTYALLALYPFGLAHMMGHMHRQRRRHLHTGPFKTRSSGGGIALKSQ
ncbi:tyrosine phosphatase-like protein [Piptocephalis cylindrospora]|uniref:Very-long-chain (3R)-3-hydroxyacyl-CoA dehydratase n=1 Tax=Piptocephalis cylindrospora TaxID=1907219 RepID=A0A4P9Y7T9_9FUNG|nr:tyrosine phosphatase-like protein [Piptocephalis cylindrospora]|eukprot:RKP14824.1 tyrosine phosphatase-like protein [Piptocephalis cylindrospora]